MREPKMKPEDMKFCAIVPVYRHEKASRNVAETLAAQNLAVILVDDGNTPKVTKSWSRLQRTFRIRRL